MISPATLAAVRKALAEAPRPMTDPVLYMDWFFKTRLEALALLDGEPAEPQERIVRAAIRLGDAVYSVPRPGRHGDVIALMAQRPKHVAGEASPDNQGFLTSAGYFVGRSEALAIASAAGQIVHQSSGPNPTELFTEDLW